METLLLYTTEPAAFWRALSEVAHAARAVWHDDPPEVAIELAERCRLYVRERQVAAPAPHEARQLGGGAREVVIDCHNPPLAQAFLADVLDRVPGFVEVDGDGTVMSTRSYAAAIRPPLPEEQDL